MRNLTQLIFLTVVITILGCKGGNGNNTKSDENKIQNIITPSNDKKDENLNLSLDDNLGKESQDIFEENQNLQPNKPVNNQSNQKPVDNQSNQNIDNSSSNQTNKDNSPSKNKENNNLPNQVDDGKSNTQNKDDNKENKSDNNQNKEEDIKNKSNNQNDENNKENKSPNKNNGDTGKNITQITADFKRFLNLNCEKNIGGFEIKLQFEQDINENSFNINIEEMKKDGRNVNILGPKIYGKTLFFGAYSYGDKKSVEELNILYFDNSLNAIVTDYIIVDIAGNIIDDPQLEFKQR